MKNIHGKNENDLTLVLGASGKTGSRIVARLSEQGVALRAASRRASPAFDWDNPDGWDAVLEGVSKVYISYAPDVAIPGATDSIRAFVQRAVERGVGRLVLLSGRGEEEAQKCEQIVQNSGIQWTVVRCSWFNQNFSEGEFFDMVMDGAVTLPAGDVPEPFLDTDDIADVAVAALTEDGHEGQIYELTGPRLMTFQQAVAEIAEACGRDIQYIQIPHDALVTAAAESGAPEEIVWLLDYLFATVLDGRNAYLTDGVQRALGRDPTDFSEYARKVAAQGRWLRRVYGMDPPLMMPRWRDAADKSLWRNSFARDN
jgi:uncharacterized protein YbjT (DUF2867 family)